MNKKLTTIWGVGLVLVLMVSLLVGALPVAGKNLDFTPETLPSATNNILVSGSSLTDIAVAGDGQTIYVAAGGTTVYKSTDGGATWSGKATTSGGANGISATYVAVAPDDPNIVIIADTTGNVSVSTNGATTWGDLATSGATTLNDLALSADYSGDHYVAVAGVATTTTVIKYYKLGIGGAWTTLTTGTKSGGFHSGSTANGSLAVEFSPNFSSDQVLVAITDNATNGLYLEMFSVNLGSWNSSAGFDNFPVRIDTSGSAKILSATRANLALAPTYLGGDEVERVVFVGVDGASGEDGVYRVEDYTDKHIKTGAAVYSVTYDGNVLVAGTTDARVWRSNDALATTPTFYVSAETKSPGGASNPVLAYAGANVVCVTAGSESAFSMSIDSGMSFNDISLIDTQLTSLLDGAAATDGSAKYFLSTDENHNQLSLWRKAGMGAWQRTLSISDNNCIIRIAPANPDVIYVAKPTAKTLYFSKDGGTTRWYSRTSRYNIQDIAVESEDVAYVGVDAAGTVSKTVNSGFTWATSKSTQLMSGGNVHSITSVAEDQVLVGGSNGFVSYSTDGADSWTRIEQNIKTGAPAVNVYVTSAALEPGGYIYAAAETSAGAAYGDVTRWGIGQPQSVPWFSLATPTTTNYRGRGIALRGGVLYANMALASTGGEIQRTLKPTIAVADATEWGSWDTADSTPVRAQVGNLIVTDGAFKGVAGHSIYVITGTFWRSCIDTLALAGPVATLPADGAEVRLNPISGNINNVSLTWSRASEATSYEVDVAYDKDFNEILSNTTAIDSTSDPASVNVGGGNLNLGTTYYWRVRADRANGTTATGDTVLSPWSEARSFSVESGGTVSPGILSPENGGYVAQTSPSFSWAPVSGAARYEFQLSADTSFAAPLASTQHAAAGASPDVTLEVGTTYYWRVRSIEPSMGEWSTIANFTVSDSVPGQSGTGDVNVTVPEIVIPEIVIPPAEVTLPPQPDTTPAISEGLLWAVIIIGAVLVIALIVLIVRTRRTV